MKTHSMSWMKADEVKSLSLIITVLFVSLFSLIFLYFFNIQELTIQQKIEYTIQVAATIGIIFCGFAVSINASYTSILARVLEQSPLLKILENKLTKDKTMKIKCVEKAENQFIPNYFSQALEQLGNEKIETRLGAIYTLEGIAKSAPNDYWTVIKTLAAFVRENAPVMEEEEGIKSELIKLPTDIQAALTVIGRRDAEKDPEGEKLDLRNIDISGADLAESDFQWADFSGAKLESVNFYAANLLGAEFTGANLKEAILYEAHMSEATLYETNLQQVVLRKANLSDAIFYKANLQEAILLDANLSDAILYETNLQGAILNDADMSGTILEGSNLQGANLIGANLQDANLIGANLQGALLATADMSGANLYEAILIKANLYETNLYGANLMKANLQFTILSQANLIAADFTRAINLEIEQIESAIGDCTTILPENCDTPGHWPESIDSDDFLGLQTEVFTSEE